MEVSEDYISKAIKNLSKQGYISKVSSCSSSGKKHRTITLTKPDNIQVCSESEPDNIQIIKPDNIQICQPDDIQDNNTKIDKKRNISVNSSSKGSTASMLYLDSKSPSSFRDSSKTDKLDFLESELVKYDLDENTLESVRCYCRKKMQ